jgi:hypothetical protein
LLLASLAAWTLLLFFLAIAAAGPCLCDIVTFFLSGSCPEEGSRADATGLAPKKSAYRKNPLVLDTAAKADLQLAILGESRRLPTPIRRAAIYLHSELKLSITVVTVPFALTVRWKFSWISRLLPGPWPMILKLFTNEISKGPPSRWFGTPFLLWPGTWSRLSAPGR